jgi:hypothetical protein
MMKKPKAVGSWARLLAGLIVIMPLAARADENAQAGQTAGEEKAPADTPSFVTGAGTPIRDAAGMTNQAAMALSHPAAVEEEGWWPEVQGFLAKRLEVGARWTYFNLNDTRRENFDANGTFTGGFLGSINQLNAKQEYWPLPVVRFNVIPYAGIELSYDHIRAETRTYFDAHTDGTFDLRGPLVALYGRYPNKTRFTPSLGVGLAFYGTDFEEDAWWHGDTQPPGPVMQWIDTTRTTGYFLFVACDIAIYKQWSAELYARDMSADVDGHYTITTRDLTVIDDFGTTKFPMSYWAAGLGVKYCF